MRIDDLRWLLLLALCLPPLFFLPMPLIAADAPQTPQGGEGNGLVAVQVKQVLLINDAPAVLLLDQSEKQFLLMYIDFFMANAIRMGMDGPQLERPLTHDLIGILLSRLGGKVRKITIHELKNNTYYALISLQVNGSVEEIDARPSDAMAIAVRLRAPIFAAGSLLKPVERSPEAEPSLPLKKPGPAQGDT